MTHLRCTSIPNENQILKSKRNPEKVCFIKSSNALHTNILVFIIIFKLNSIFFTVNFQTPILSRRRTSKAHIKPTTTNSLYGNILFGKQTACFHGTCDLRRVVVEERN